MPVNFETPAGERMYLDRGCLKIVELAGFIRPIQDDAEGVVSVNTLSWTTRTHEACDLEMGLDDDRLGRSSLADTTQRGFGEGPESAKLELQSRGRATQSRNEPALPLLRLRPCEVLVVIL